MIALETHCQEFKHLNNQLAVQLKHLSEAEHFPRADTSGIEAEITFLRSEINTTLWDIDAERERLLGQDEALEADIAEILERYGVALVG